MKDSKLPYVTVCISDGYVDKCLRLDPLELGKEDPKITWIK